MKNILLLLLFIPTLYAKEYSIIINKPFNQGLVDITQNLDRSISAVGFTKEYKSTYNQSATYTDAFSYLSSLSNSNGSQISFIKIDKNAHVTFEKESNMSRFSKAVSLLKTPSNTYVIGGYTLDGSLLIRKIDSNANVIFSKTFGTKNYNKMHNLVALSDGGVLAVGSSITSRSAHDPMFESGLGLNDIYLARFTKDGKKLWSKKYGTQYDDIGVDAVEAQDGSIVVLSTTSHDTYQNITLMRISGNGNKIWLKKFNENNKVTPYKIIKLRDNNFLLSLAQRNELGKEQIRLVKFNLQKNILLDKKVTTSYSSVLKDIKEYSDGRIIGVGYVKDTYNTNGLVMILNNSLNLLHQEHFGNENYDVFNAVTIMHNSQAAVAGLHTSPESQESNMWVVKINQDATMAQVSTKIENMYISLTKLFKEEIKQGTLQIQEDLTLNFTDTKLLFAIGEYTLTPVQKMYINKFSKKLIPFLYAHKEYIKALQVNGHTSSEWKNSTFKANYLKNEKLSMRRSFSTLSQIFNEQNLTTQKWLSKVMQGSGLGFSKKIIFDNVEYKRRSRRVSFKLIL